MREPVYETIDREEWERRETAMDVRDRAQDIIDENFRDQPIYVSFGADDQSPIGFGVGIEVENDERLDFSIEEIEDTFPTEATGYTPEEDPKMREDIPIVVNEVEGHKTAADYQYNDFPEVPGGQRVQTNTEIGTIMGTFHSDQYGDGLITAGHAFDAEGDEAWEKVGPDTADVETLGYARDVVENPPVDCAFIEPHDWQSVTDHITSSNNSQLEFPIDGYYSDSALEYNEGTGWEVEMQGKASGRVSGNLKKTIGSPTQAVKIDSAMDNGDSGGPIFRSKGGGAYIIGDIYKASNFYGWTKGTTIETIEDELGGYVY